MARKVFVAVTARHDAEGNLKPLSIEWTDDRMYEIDRVLDVRRAASMKAGGIGVRYICRIRGKETCLFREGDRWFVEAKE